jgi:hypothetical protein
MFRRPLQQLMNKRFFSNENCKINVERMRNNEQMVSCIYVLCLANTFAISALLLRKR